MRIVNLTPHTVNIVEDNNVVKTFPSEGNARVATTAKVVAKFDGIDVVETAYGDVEGLPAPEDFTYYIVSMLVRDAAKAAGRTDLVSPDTAPGSVVRDAAGQIIGVKRFAR